MARQRTSKTMKVIFASILLISIPSAIGFGIDQPSISGRTGEFLGKTITSKINKNNNVNASRNLREQKKREWIERSVTYYSKVMRDDRRRETDQGFLFNSQEEEKRYVELAMKHYFALTKVRKGEFDHAERIYRRTIDEIIQEGEEEGGCDHAKLAVSTLLLALHTQRSGDVKKTRSVFTEFLRFAYMDGNVTDCSCSARVLQAFALFEMKNGLPTKSLVIIRKAIELDESLATILEWTQFRRAIESSNSG
mmetsp:Transcript_285/g.412  ORF Transcript_285/g.412 Transcript_285/m.412 type:complete len:251 (+) Transcript_285:131-883(+)